MCAKGPGAPHVTEIIHVIFFIETSHWTSRGLNGHMKRIKGTLNRKDPGISYSIAIKYNIYIFLLLTGRRATCTKQYEFL